MARLEGRAVARCSRRYSSTVWCCPAATRWLPFGLTLTFGVMRMVNFAEGQSVNDRRVRRLHDPCPYVRLCPGAIAAAMAVNAVLGIIPGSARLFRPFRGVELNGPDRLDGAWSIISGERSPNWSWGHDRHGPFETAYNEISINFRHSRPSACKRLICVAASRRHPPWPVVAGPIYQPSVENSAAVSEDHENRLRHGHRRQPGVAPRAGHRLDDGGLRRARSPAR